VAAPLLWSCGCGNGGDAKPDLVLVVIDTLRADHLSTYGYQRNTSPAIDALAAGGVVFEDATSQSSWTLPSMASMLSGRRVFVNAYTMPPTIPTLAERLANAGYETVAFVANPAISARGGFDRGFETFVTREDTGNQTWDAPDLERAFTTWLDEHPPGDRPRFIYLHYLDPHYPYEPPDDVRLDGEVPLANGTITAWVRETKATPDGSPMRRQFDRDRRSIIESIDRYDREILAVDASVERMLRAIDSSHGSRTQPRERVVAIASDHGEGLWDHRHHPKLIERDLDQDQRTIREVFFRDHSYHLYRELVHTPLILVGPGFTPGDRVDVMVENVDLVPTFLRAAGLDDDASLDGEALQEIAAGGRARRGFVFSHANEGTMLRGVDSPWKFVFPTNTGFSFGMEIQLYNLNSDPTERDNLADSKHDELRRFIEVRQRTIDSFSLYDSAENEIDPETREVLDQMGYTGVGRNQ